MKNTNLLFFIMYSINLENKTTFSCKSLLKLADNSGGLPQENPFIFVTQMVRQISPTAPHTMESAFRPAKKGEPIGRTGAKRR